MRVDELKEYIVDNNCIETILEELGCGNIREHDGYFTASNPDGNNPQALTVYNNESLITINYTRNIAKNKRATDIFDLVSFYQDCSFPEALKYVHNVLRLDYYSEDAHIPEDLQVLRMLIELNKDSDEEDNTPVKPISNTILDYLLPYGNKMWCDEGISLTTQAEFNIAYDPQTNYIAIPIFDEIGSLVGIKGRYFGQPDEYHVKYIYLERCNKSRILYGYWLNKEYIKKAQDGLNKYINAGLAVDGSIGALTRKATAKALQYSLNRDYGANLVLDGAIGAKTLGAIKGHAVKKGSRTFLVTWLEIALMLLNYYTSTIEIAGNFGAGVDKAVREFQKDNGLVVDGSAGEKTINEIINKLGLL